MACRSKRWRGSSYAERQRAWIHKDSVATGNSARSCGSRGGLVHASLPDAYVRDGGGRKVGPRHRGRVGRLSVGGRGKRRRLARVATAGQLIGTRRSRVRRVQADSDGTLKDGVQSGIFCSRTKSHSSHQDLRIHSGRQIRLGNLDRAPGAAAPGPSSPG